STWRRPSLRECYKDSWRDKQTVPCSSTGYTLSTPLYTAPMTVRILTSGSYIMTRVSRTAYWVFVVSSILASALTATAQINPDLYAGLNWRNVGPFHGGRISSVTGAIGQPGVFYAGTPLGGIWKTTSAGVTWFPIFDQEKSVDSIGAIQVAPSNPDIVYAGTGDPIQGSLGNGMW